jgi:hypothetical protein
MGVAKAITVGIQFEPQTIHQRQTIKANAWYPNLTRAITFVTTLESNWQSPTITSICRSSLLNVPTWSSDPLEIAAACIGLSSLRHRPDQCMRSVHDLKEVTWPIFPSHRQKSAFLLAPRHKEVRIALWCV